LFWHLCTLRTFGDADFFGVKERAIEVMEALKGRGVRWQAGVNTSASHDARLLELAAESGCFQLCIGFESISKTALRNVHKSTKEPKAPRTGDGSKQAQLIAMLRRAKGATVDEIAEALSWQPHTVRGAIACALKKKLGLEVTSEKDEKRGRIYRIANAG